MRPQFGLYQKRAGVRTPWTSSTPPPPSPALLPPSLDTRLNRYETKFPFKEHSKILLDNYELTQCRFKRLKRSLDKIKILLAEYSNNIREYIEKGIVEVEVVEPDDVTDKPGSTHYLPHRAVIRENHSTTKVRIVFDGSAHNENEPSINDVLYSGPCLLPLIFGILIRFCIGKSKLWPTLLKFPFTN